MTKGLFVLVFFQILLQGCTHLKTRDFSRFREGAWEGKALIHDKRNSKSGIVNLRIKSVVYEKLRMDFTTPVGTHIGSVLILGNDMQYLNTADKAVYKSRSESGSFQNVLLIPLDPAAFYGILFDRSIDNKNWNCSKDESGMLLQCLDKKSKVTIDWKNREGEKRTISIQHKNASVQLNLYNFEDTVDNPEKAFSLPVPSSFKIRNI